MCSFTVLGRSGGVRKPVSIWCDHHLPSPSHKVDQVVDCGLWNVGPLLFNGCAKLLDIGRNWNTLLYTPIQSIPNMLNGWHVRWVCWPCKNWDVFSIQELCTDPCNMGPCIIMLQHEVMVVDEWHNSHLPCTVKAGIHPWREHLSKEPDAIKCEHLPTQVGYDDKLQSGRDPDEDDEHADELPWDGFWQFVQKFFGYANWLLQQLSGWLVSDDLGGKDAGCGGPGLVWLHVVCGCEAGWLYCQILWNAFGDGLW